MNEGATEDVPRAGRVHHVHGETGRTDHGVPHQQHRTPFAERDAQHRVMRAPQGAQRTRHVAVAGERFRYVLGEDRHGHRVDEVPRAIGDTVDVARDDHPGSGTDARCRKGRRLVLIVHVQQPRAGQHVRAQFPSVEREGGIARPEHHAIATRFVDGDDRVAVRAGLRGRGAGVDATAGEFVAHPRPMGITAEGAHIRGTQSERGTRAERRRRLAARRHAMREHRLLGRAGAGERVRRHHVDEVERIGPHADDIEHHAHVRGYLSAEGCRCSSYRARAVAVATLSESTPGAIGMRA